MRISLGSASGYRSCARSSAAARLIVGPPLVVVRGSTRSFARSHKPRPPPSAPSAPAGGAPSPRENMPCIRAALAAPSAGLIILCAPDIKPSPCIMPCTPPTTAAPANVVAAEVSACRALPPAIMVPRPEPSAAAPAVPSVPAIAPTPGSATLRISGANGRMALPTRFTARPMLLIKNSGCPV